MISGAHSSAVERFVHIEEALGSNPCARTSPLRGSAQAQLSVNTSMIAIIFTIIQLCFAIFIFYLLIAFVTGAPFVPSTNPVAKKMVEFANIKKGMTVYDLGSGDGKLLFAAAHLGARNAIGLEINPFLVFYTKLRAFFSPYRGIVKAQWKNFWRSSFPHADVVFIYLLPWRMEALEKHLMKHLAPGTRIVSNSFIFPHLTLIDQDKERHVYVFEI